MLSLSGHEETAGVFQVFCSVAAGRPRLPPPWCRSPARKYCSDFYTRCKTAARRCSTSTARCWCPMARGTLLSTEAVDCCHLRIAVLFAWHRRFSPNGGRDDLADGYATRCAVPQRYRCCLLDSSVSGAAERPSALACSGFGRGALASAFGLDYRAVRPQIGLWRRERFQR